MQWLKMFLLVLVGVTSFITLDAKPQKVDPKQRYFERVKHKRLVSVSDHASTNSLLIELNDGSVWDCTYKTIEDKLTVLQKWSIGQDIIIIRRKDSYHLYCICNQASCYVGLSARLDPASAHVLPVITAKTADNNILLSDGTEWKDESRFISVAKYWNVGEKIFITVHNNNFVLMNLDQVPGLFYDVDYMNASLVNIIQ